MYFLHFPLPPPSWFAPVFLLNGLSLHEITYFHEQAIEGEQATQPKGQTGNQHLHAQLRPQRLAKTGILAATARGVRDLQFCHIDQTR